MGNEITQKKNSADSIKKKISHLFKWIKIESEKFFSRLAVTKLRVKQKSVLKLKVQAKFLQTRQCLGKGQMTSQVYK